MHLVRAYPPPDPAAPADLTTTDAYFADREPPPARGAVVRVSDDALAFSPPLSVFDWAGGRRAAIEFRDPPGVRTYYLWFTAP